MTGLRILGMSFSKLINKILYSYKDPLLIQRKILTNIIKVNKNTLFGKIHKFSQIKSIKDFQSHCPIYTYSDIEPYIKKMLNGEKNVLIGSKQIYWGKTAGTSGTQKFIPITRKSIFNASKCSLRIILSYISENTKENSKILDGIMYLYSSDPYLGEINGLPVGFGTGAFDQSSSTGFLRFLKLNLYSNSKFYNIKNFDIRTNMMVQDCCKLNITSFFGVTSILINFMETILQKAPDLGIQAEKLIDIFPNYKFSIMGGEPLQFYRNRLRHVVGSEVDCRELYGATEEIIAAQFGSKSSLTPMLDANFFEFVPVDNPEERLLINEINKHKEYFIIITNYNGLYSYNLGDIIEFVSTTPPLLIFKRRKDTINLASEKITLDQLYRSIRNANQKFGSKTKDYIICGIFHPKPRYILLIEFFPNSHPTDYNKYLFEFNSNLMKYSSVYADLIKVQHAISPPIMWVLENDSFKKYQIQILNNGHPAGQAKFPRITVKKEILEYFSKKIIKKVEI
ncbi:MAG: GH3 family domain-containing protein [Candidatus Helarchaeota archaeon]